MNDPTLVEIRGYMRDHSVWPSMQGYEIVSVFLVGFAALYDITSKTRPPKRPQKIWQILSSPFRNFLTLQDLEEPVGRAACRSRSKIACLVALGLLQSALYLGRFVFALVSGGPAATGLLLLCLAWVRGHFQ